MLHTVYHEKYEPLIVETADYVALLSSGEWFDNPDLNSGDIENEIKKYEIQREEPEYECCRCGERRHVQSKSQPRPKKKQLKLSDAEGQDEKGLESTADNAKPPAKKRGRPSKK